MSVIRAIQPIRPVAPRRHLRSLPTVKPATRPSPDSVKSVRTSTSPSIRSKIAIRGAIGLGIILAGNLYLSALSNEAIYTISELKKESKVLATKAQIVDQQVDSLRSPQNLADSARNLGMIVNSNPVFLKVREGKVLGFAVPASLDSSKAISANLIANAALISKSNPQNYAQNAVTKLEIPKTSIPSVKKANSPLTEVVLPSVGIPASPTH